MKYLFFACLVLTSCGGKLSDDQRKRLHEGMSTQDIKKISEADLQEAAMTDAHSVILDVENKDKFLKEPGKIDSIARARGVKIYSIVPNDSTLREIEKRLIEAYITGADVGQVGDNLQRIGEDSLLFTRPFLKNRPDGSQEFSHAIGIKMSKKTIVLSMPQP
jgi:hypothetical protein